MNTSYITLTSGFIFGQEVIKNLHFFRATHYHCPSLLLLLLLHVYANGVLTV